MTSDCVSVLDDYILYDRICINRFVHEIHFLTRGASVQLEPKCSSWKNRKADLVDYRFVTTIFEVVLVVFVSLAAFTLGLSGKEIGFAPFALAKGLDASFVSFVTFDGLVALVILAGIVALVFPFSATATQRVSARRMVPIANPTAIEFFMVIPSRF